MSLAACERMKAFRLTHWARPAEVTDTSVAAPGPGQVLIRIAGTGASHSDLHLMDWPEGQFPWRLPFTLGHETAGWIVELGAGVTGFAKGEAVLVYGSWGCGTCRTCRLGRENYCEKPPHSGVLGGGLGADGGMAEYMLVPSARFLVPIGALDPVHAAPLADAGLTAYSAIASARAHLAPGSTAVVIGAGGLGQMAIQILRATTGATIVAADIEEKKLAVAKQLGADVCVRSDSRAADLVMRAVGRADVVLDMVGANSTLVLAAKMVRAEGRVVIVGLAGGELPVTFFNVPHGVSIATSHGGSIPELMELVALAQNGDIRVEVETFPLAQAPEVYAKLRRGEVRGRAVIVPAGA